VYILTSVFTLSRVEAKNNSFKRFKIKKGLLKKDSFKKYKKVYDNQTKRTRIIGDQMIVKFKKNHRKSNVQRFVLKNNLRYVDKLGKRTYVFAAYDPNSLLSTLNNLEEDKKERARNLIVKADVDEYKELSSHAQRKRRRKRNKQIGNFSLERQWHLKNMGGDSVSKAGSDINIEEAWKITQGEGIIVAVIDTGFDIKHNDINFLNIGYSTVTDTYSAKAPSYSNENHGTAVAGIIAAKDNKRGSVGVAPKAKIIPIRLISDRGMVATSQIIKAHQKAIEMGARVINNSWGTYDSSLGDGELLELTDLEKSLYRNLATTAHSGRGVTVIFAAGNSGEGSFAAHPEARNEYTLAIGAIDSKDRKARYSVYGNELDVVAPGGQEKGITTTDRRDRRKSGGLLGYARGSYTDTFTGTSAAAPVVAGIAALVLSVNPDLTADEVKEIIRQSARHDLDNYYQFQNGKSDEIGYGIVDAGAAVELAKNW
jgi:subtilisin family serine protease